MYINLQKLWVVWGPFLESGIICLVPASEDLYPSLLLDLERDAWSEPRRIDELLGECRTNGAFNALQSIGNNQVDLLYTSLFEGVQFQLPIQSSFCWVIHYAKDPSSAIGAQTQHRVVSLLRHTVRPASWGKRGINTDYRMSASIVWFFKIKTVSEIVTETIRDNA